MAAITIIKYVIAFAVAYLSYMLFAPIVFQTRYENPAWDNLPAEYLAFGDQIYGIWALVAIIVAAVILLAAWNESSKNRALAN